MEKRNTNSLGEAVQAVSEMTVSCYAEYVGYEKMTADEFIDGTKTRMKKIKRKKRQPIMVLRLLKKRIRQFVPMFHGTPPKLRRVLQHPFRTPSQTSCGQLERLQLTYSIVYGF